MKGVLGVTRKNAQTDFLRLNDFLDAKFKGTNYKIGTSPAFQVGNRYGINPDLLKGVKKIPSQYIIASSGQVLHGENTGDIFGWSTDLSEDGLTLAVGSILNDNTNGLNSGSVRVYTRSNPDEAWVQKGVDIDGEAAQDYSGWSITLSADGDRLVVGAVFNDDSGGVNTGHVRIYDWNAGTSQWALYHEIVGSTSGDFFGYSVSLSKDKTRLAVGAPYGLDERGFVSVYYDDGTTWQHIANVNDSSLLDKSQFGKRLALNDDGSRLTLSAPHALGDRGIVYLYGVTQSEVTYLAVKQGPGLDVMFGQALDFKVNTVVVGELSSTPVRVFDVSSDTFDERAAPGNLYFRSSETRLKLSYDGNSLLLSMPALTSEENAINSTPLPRSLFRRQAIAQIYAREGDAWTQRAWDMKSNANDEDEYGKSVSLSGDGSVICISAPRSDAVSTDQGYVSAFTVRPISYYVKPTINLNGLNPQPVEANTSYVEAGAVTDTGAAVTIVGNIEDNTIEGRQYTVRYTASSAFATTTVDRTVVITKDPTAPVVTLSGDSTMFVTVGGVFNDPGATSSLPGTVTADDSEVNFNAVGEYKIKYSAVSTYGISSVSSAFRTLFVIYGSEIEPSLPSRKRLCMSRDGFIASAADFANNSVKLYEWDPITPKAWKQIGQELTGPDATYFGTAVDLSTDGLTVAIGAPLFNTFSGAAFAGVVRVYKFDFLVNAWEKKGDDITDSVAGDKMGEIVSISGDGDVVSVGSTAPISSKNPFVFTYRYSAATDTWSKIHSYTEPLKIQSSHLFSTSLNHDGSRLLLGASVNNYNTGAVFLFNTLTDEKLVSVFGNQLGDVLGRSVRLSKDGRRFAFSATGFAFSATGFVKVYAEDSQTGFWGQLGEALTFSGADDLGANLGAHVDLSSGGNIVTFSDPSTSQGVGKIFQYAWNGRYWVKNIDEVTNGVAGTFFGRRFFVTEDGSKILSESSTASRFFRWNVSRPTFSLNGGRLLSKQLGQAYAYDHVTTTGTVTFTGNVNPDVTSDYIVKYLVSNDLNLSEVVYQVVSVSGNFLQLCLDVVSFDESSTPSNLGWSASMSNDGERMAVGAPGYENSTGMVKIYDFNPNTINWDLTQTIVGPTVSGSFGFAVCLSKDGSRIAVGAPDHGNGLVRVYEYTNTWTQIGSDLSGTADGKFGYSVALNLEGSLLAVVEPRKAFDVNTGVGRVTTFSYGINTWTQLSTFENTQLEHELGYDVAITSTTNEVLVGAPTGGPGYVRLSSYLSGNVPIFAQPLVFGEKFGWAVSISDDGNTFAVGAPFYNNRTGRVLVFDATQTPPSLKGSPLIGSAPLSEFGSSVHLSGNGTKLVVYTERGRVAAYRYTDPEWVVISTEIITAPSLDTKFGYALAGSADGRRVITSSPLFDGGSGMVEVYSTETTKISLADFVPPTITLNGAESFRVQTGTTFNDPGVRRDDGLSVLNAALNPPDVNTVGTYTVNYSVTDAAGNPSVNQLSRVVEVLDFSVNNVKRQIDGPLEGMNNSTVDVSQDGSRIAVCTGAQPQTYINSLGGSQNSDGVNGNVVVYDRDVTAYPPVFQQVGQTISQAGASYFATSVQLSQDGTKLAVMNSPDASNAGISMYGLHAAGVTVEPTPSPFFRSETDDSFALPSSSTTSITSVPSAGNLFGRDQSTQYYRYKNVAASSDGSIVAVGKPTGSTGVVSVYRRSGVTVTVGNLTSQGQVGSHTGLTATDSDISSNGERIIFCDDETTFIYNTIGNVQEAAFTSTEKANALSDNGTIAVVASKKIIEYTPITLTGGDRVSVAHGSSWSDPGFVYTGSDAVTVTGTVNTSQPGEYIIQYTTEKSVQIRVVSVEANLITFNASHSATNIPYGPGFAGWTGTWRTRDFTLFTVPSSYGVLSNDNFNLSITLTGKIPVAGNWQYQSIQIFTDNGFSSSIGFTSNGSESGVSYSWSGSVYTNHTRTTSSTPSGFLSGGDVVKGRLHLYNTYYSTFSVNVDVQFSNPVSGQDFAPTITLLGLPENSISIGDDFVDPGATSSDSVSVYISPTFPQAVSCRKAIVYRAVSVSGIIAYAVRYVDVEDVPKVVVYQRVLDTWSLFPSRISQTDQSGAIFLARNLDTYNTNLAISESGYRVAIAKYIQGEVNIFTYEYDQNLYPPAWVQYGSTIQRSSGSSVALSGDGTRLVMGGAGEVHVYNYVSGDWVRHAQDLWTLTTSAFATLGVVDYTMDLYGDSVDISKDGAHITVGAPLNTTGRGHVSVYTVSGTNFVLKGDPLIRDVSEPEFGREVSISNTGNNIVTNAAATVGGAYKIVKYIYENNAWSEFGSGIAYTTPFVSAVLAGNATKIVSVTSAGVFTVHPTVTTQLPIGWEQMGADITVSSITAPGPDTNPSPAPGSRYSPGTFNTTTNVTGYAVDLSFDGTVLAIGLPFLEMGGGSPFVANARGAAAVFAWDGTAWNQLGGTIVPKYVYDASLTTKYNGTTSVANLNADAEANMLSGASISLSGDGQYLCVGSPGHLPNPIDLFSELNDSLPNEAGITSWTLYRRDASYAPTNDLYSVGWEPVVTKYSEISASLSTYTQASNVNETKRELLGLSVKVSSDGSFVAYDTRTDGVKILAPVSGTWSVYQTLVTGNTTFLESNSALTQNMPHESSFTEAPGATYGHGNFPSRLWPVAYLSMSKDNRLLSVTQPKHSLGREGKVTVYKSPSQTLQNFAQVGQVIQERGTFTDSITTNYESQILSKGGYWGDANAGGTPSDSISWAPALGNPESLGFRCGVPPYQRDTGVWLPVTFGAVWSVSFDWELEFIFGNNNIGEDIFGNNMRFIFYATNQPSSKNASQHGGYSVVHDFSGADTHVIRDQTDATLSSVTLPGAYPVVHTGVDEYGRPNYPPMGWRNGLVRTVTVSYDHGVLTTNVSGVSGTNRTYAFTTEELITQRALWGTTTYIAIATDNSHPVVPYFDWLSPTCNQYLRNINLSWNSTIIPSNTQAWNLDEFAFSETTLTEHGESLAIAHGVVPDRANESDVVPNYQKRFSIYDYDEFSQQWNFRDSELIYDSAARQFDAPENNFLTILSSDGNRVTSLYFGDDQIMRQHMVTRVNEQNLWKRIGSLLTLSAPNVNNQHWNLNTVVAGEPPFERIPAFSMSTDGTKIAIGNTRGTKLFTSSSSTLEHGTVTVFTLNASTSEYESSYELTVPDTATYTGNTQPARFGHALKLLGDGNSLVVSAPSSRNGFGDIFFYDTTSPTNAAVKAPPLANTSNSSQGMFGYAIGIAEDFSRLFVGDPGDASGNGRIIVHEYDTNTQSWINPQNITKDRLAETAANVSLSTNARFGQAFDISDDGNTVIAGYFGENIVGSITQSDFVSHHDALGGFEIAEVWDYSGAVWALRSTVPQRVKTGSAINTAGGNIDRFQFLMDNKNINPNVKLSGNGQLAVYGLSSLKDTSNPAVRHTSNLIIMRTNFEVTPDISLVGEDVVFSPVGNAYVDPGAVTDDVGDVIVTTGEVDINTLGNYVVRHTVNRAGILNFVERTVTVFIPENPPTVTLIGDATVTLNQGESYTEPNPAVTVTGGVLERSGTPPTGSVAGTFTIRYVARNVFGVASTERVVTVVADTTPPVITIFGGDVVHKLGTVYRDASFVGSDGNETVFTITPTYVLTSRDIGNFLGTTPVTYRATDQAGNAGTTARNVTVKNVFDTASVQVPGTSHYSTLSSTGNRVASVESFGKLRLYETGGALVNTWTGLGSLVGQMVDLNSDGTIVAFTTTVGVYVYEYTTSWVERPPHSSYPRFTVSGSSAYRIDLSDDGDTLAVSYPGGTAAFTEEVAVFRWRTFRSTYELDYNQGSATSIGLGNAMSLNSNGTRLVLGYMNSSPPSASITSGSSFANPPPTLNGVSQESKFGGSYYKLTSFRQYGSNNTMYWQLNLGSSWNCSWDWYIDGNEWSADDMRLIYFAPNPITAYQASTHGGYNNFYEFWLGDTHQIRDNNDVSKQTQDVYYFTDRMLKVSVSYANGVMTSSVRERDGFQQHVSTLSHDFGTAHQHLYNTPTYFGFSGRTGGASASQYIGNIELTGVDDVGVIEVFDRVGLGSWSQVGSDINGGSENQKLGTVVKVSGDGSTILNVNEGTDGNQQKVSVYTLNSGTWTKNASLLDTILSRTTVSGDTEDLVDLNDDGSFIVYAGTRTVTAADHPNGLTSKYLDGFKLDGGVYKNVFTQRLPSDSINHVSLAGDASRALVHTGQETSVFDVTETVFDPIITLTQDDDVDTLTVVGTYTEQGATSNVTDGSSVTVGGDTVTAAAGTYRVTYSVTDSNTGRSGFRTRVVIISET
jgi:hypothetical protein